jgi:hypothetical protein
MHPRMFRSAPARRRGLPQPFTSGKVSPILPFYTDHSKGTAAMPSPASGILTIPEIAKHLKVTEKTIYKLAGAKKIPVF